MKKNRKYRVFLIQAYNTPYRNGLFNELNNFSDIELYVIYDNKLSEIRNQWIINDDKNFKEIQLGLIYNRKIDYYNNKSIFNPFHVLWLLVKYRPNVIICSPTNLGIFLSILKAIIRFKLIYWSESTILTENNRKFRRKHLPFIKSVDSIIVPGLLAKEFLLYASNNMLLDRVIHFMPNSVDEIFNTKIEDIQNKFNNIQMLKIAYIGNLIKLKGILPLIEAIQSLKDFNTRIPIEFHFIGDGPLIKELPNFDNVKIEGFMQKSEIALFLKRNHVIIVPSLFDCNPLVIVEALKTGNIILSSDGVGNYPEMVQDNGFIFKRSDSMEIRKVILTLSSLNDQKLSEMAIISKVLGENISHKNSATIMREAIISILSNSSL